MDTGSIFYVNFNDFDLKIKPWKSDRKESQGFYNDQFKGFCVDVDIHTDLGIH